VAIKGKIE